MKILYTLSLVILLTGCQKEAILPDPNSTVLTVRNQPGWKADLLNPDYTIQFPNNYEGNGMVGFEGPTFSKYRIDKQVTFSYAYCGPLQCLPYGEALLFPFSAAPYPSTVTLGKEVLDQVVEIRNNGQVMAVFYFTKKVKTQGIVYLKDPNSQLLKQSLQVTYPHDSLAEVLAILQTMQPK